MEMTFKNIGFQIQPVEAIVDDARRTDDRQNVITIAHPEHFVPGELNIFYFLIVSSDYFLLSMTNFS